MKQWIEIYSGEVLTSTVESVNSYTIAKNYTLIAYSGGTADKTAVDAGGIMLVSGGTATSTTIKKDGTMTVESGSVSGISVRAGGSLTLKGAASGIDVMSGGEVRINSGGIADDLTLYINGKVTVDQNGMIRNSAQRNGSIILAGGNAEKITVYSGTLTVGNHSSAVGIDLVQQGASITVQSGGLLQSSTCDGAAVTAESGSVIYGITLTGYAVESPMEPSGKKIIRGSLTLRSGAVSRGTISITDYGKMTAEAGAVIDFTVAEQTEPATALINNWSLISGGDVADYTITVKANQASGTYVLAENASAFANTVTVKNTAGTALGTLAVGQTQSWGGASYTLGKDSGVLSLAVERTVAVSAKSDVDGNGISDVMFQWTGGDYQIGFWMNGTNNWQATGVGKPANWTLLGNCDMDCNGKADQVVFGNVLGGAYIGYYKDGDTTDNGWVTIGRLENPEGIVWDNLIGNLTGNAGCNSIVWHAAELGACGVWTDGTNNWVGITGYFDANWEMQGCGDFDGDGKDEILWKNNGNLYTTDINSDFASLGNAYGWDVRAIGDFSGDGQDDIVLFYKPTGSVMKYENGQASQWSSLGQLDAGDWFIVGAGDYNDDGIDDLLVRQYSTGMLGYYTSGDMSKWNELGRGVDMNWTVVA